MGNQSVQGKSPVYLGTSQVLGVKGPPTGLAATSSTLGDRVPCEHEQWHLDPWTVPVGELRQSWEQDVSVTLLTAGHGLFSWTPRGQGHSGRHSTKEVTTGSRG